MRKNNPTYALLLHEAIKFARVNHSPEASRFVKSAFGRSLLEALAHAVDSKDVRMTVTAEERQDVLLRRERGRTAWAQIMR